MPLTFFDIETRARDLSPAELLTLAPPPDPPAPPSPTFDESTVKLGNLKDPAKRQAKIDEAREAHTALLADYPRACQLVIDNHLAAVREQAALHAVTGEVLCIVYFDAEKRAATVDAVDVQSNTDNGIKSGEQAVLAHFWQQYSRHRKSDRKLVGLNIFDFDLPFLIRRSWIVGVDVPETVNPDASRYGWDRTVFIDLRQRWLLGQQGGANGTKSNFDHLGAAFGTGGKLDGMSGKDFAELWLSDRAKAKEYLIGEVKKPAEWARKMGVVA
jgi:hypothetical protein